MTASTLPRLTRWLALGWLFLLTSSISIQAQEAATKPERFTREYPAVSEFRLQTFRPTQRFFEDEAAKRPFWNPITVGKSDEQLVDEIELLRTSDLQPKFVHQGKFSLGDKPIVAADVSLDGTTLLTYDSDRRLTTWSLPDGKRLAEYKLNNPSAQAAIAISADGSQILFGDGSTNVLLLDAKTGQLKFTHDQLQFPIGAVAFSTNGNRIAAADIKGQAYIAEALAPGKVQSSEKFPDLRPAVDISVSNSGNYATAMASKAGVVFSTKAGYSTATLRGPPFPVAATAANDRQLWLADDRGLFEFYKDPESLKYTHKQDKFFSPPLNIRFDSQDQTAWTATASGVEVRTANYMPLFDLVRYPKIDYEVAHVLTAPDDDLLLFITSEGEVDLWQLHDNQARLHAAMLNNLQGLLEEHRFEAIELLAQRWAAEDFDLYDKEQQTLYYFLTDFVRSYHTNHWEQKTQFATYKKFLAEHPSCEFFRVVLTMDAIKMAWDCRGRGFASEVDEQESKFFQLNLEQAENMLMPLFQRKSPPCPEAYAQAMELAKVSQWTPEETTYLMTEARKNAPTYPRIYAEAAIGLMPRWGGSQEASSDLAQEVADAVGGDEGDILYAHIARGIRNYNGWYGTFESLGFSKERVMQGYAKMALRDSTRQNMHLSMAIQLAHELEDKSMGKQLAERFESVGGVPVPDVLNGGMPEFEKMMTWALDRPYQLARLEVKAPSVPAEELAPTEWELAKVEELDALVRASDRASFQKGSSFSVGKQRPWKMEISADATRAVTLDESGDLRVWDIASGKSIFELTADKAPGKGAVAISHDGKLLVIGTEQGGVEQYDLDTGEATYQVAGLPAPIHDVGMSTNGKHFYAIDAANGLHTIRDGDKKHVDIRLLNPKNEPMLEPISGSIDNHGHYLEGRRFADRVEVSVLVPQEKGLAGQKATIHTNTSMQIASGRYRFAVLNGNNLVKLQVTNPKNAQYEAYSQRMLQDIRRCKFATNGRQFWFLTDRCIDIRDWEGSRHEGPVKLPAEIETVEGIRLAPDAGMFLNFDAEGNVTTWNLEGNPLSREYLLALELVKLMQEGRYNTLELLSQRWERENTPALDAIADNLYSSLILRLNLVSVRSGEAEEYEKKLRDYLAVRPDSKLIRLALFELKYDLARKARGDKPDASTPGNVLSEYRDQMEECKEILTPLIQRDDAPPEAFAAAVRLGRDLNWTRSQMKFVLDRAADKAPSYARVYAEAAMTHLPKNGGTDEEAEAYATSIADRIEGPQGEALYFQIAFYLAESEGWPAMFQELNFSRDRILSGLIEIAKDYPRRTIVRLGMQLAQAGNREEAGQTLAEIIETHGFVPDDHEWPTGSKSFDRAMKWATKE
ncbi:WD40 repeat domain-containing protein [Bremerella sp. JC817]|uniref:WD40 repeat domain-containing protein n=1 Tax=Bremerella sp. JC817 TaxID=3231756 RepID=UPI003458603B